MNDTVIKSFNVVENDINTQHELWEIESEHVNYVINNQIWKYYPKYEKWLKYIDDYSKIKKHFEIIEEE